MKSRVVIIALLLAQACHPKAQVMEAGKINPMNVRILRDSMGVAHIFGKTDPEVAYGLAWANAEDNFAAMQELYLIGKGMYGRLKAEGALYDIARKAFRVPQLVDEKYEKDFSPKFRAYIDGYLEGIYAYAATHPKEVLMDGIFPITGKDLTQGYVMAVMQEQGLPGELGRILGNRLKDLPLTESLGRGSNGIALSKRITEEGKTMLLINPHQPLEGFGAIYEIHLHSEDGLNVHGGLWHGSLNPATFCNEHLALMTTTNQLDFIDVYQLEMHPENKLQYKFDDKWLTLEEEKVSARARVLGFIQWPVSRRVYHSVYGTTFKNEQGFFAVRLGGNMDIKGFESLYQMNIAQDLEAFKQAAQHFPFENFIYADRADNIYLLNNGQVPRRDSTYKWRKVLPGNTSKTLWTEFLTLEEHVSYTSPKAGYLYNTNNSAYHATDSLENKLRSSYPNYLGDRYDYQNNRALRFEALIRAAGPKVSFAELKAIKYDTQLPAVSPSIGFLDSLQALDGSAYPDVAKQIASLKSWDRNCVASSEGAGTFWLIVWHLYSEGKLTGFFKDQKYDLPTCLEGLRFAKAYALQHFDKELVPMGELMRYRRGTVDLPLSGFPDVLAAVTPAMDKKDGRLKMAQGDGFTMFVLFGPAGVEVETLQGYGNSADPASPHYTDQMQLYVDRKTKRMSLDAAVVEKMAVRVYSPK